MRPAAWLFQAAALGDWRSWLGDQRTTIGEHGSRLVVIVIFLVVIDLIFRRALATLLHRAIERAGRTRAGDMVALRRRAETLVDTLNWAFSILLLFVGTGLVLGEIGLDISALIAGVGVVGIALGLGAQTLVKDVINGMFILIEDQYSVGDTVTVAGSTGEVIEINPRRTVLRDGDGNVHVIPNSAVAVAINRTGALNRMRIEFDVPFRDADRAVEMANAVGSEVAVALGGHVLAAPRVVSQRVTGAGDVRMVVVGDARSAFRWEVESEVRRKLKRRFDAERVEAQFERSDTKP